MIRKQDVIRSYCCAVIGSSFSFDDFSQTAEEHLKLSLSYCAETAWNLFFFA
jgi:hypothetical protein